MSKFVYVFSDEAKEKLLELGYTMLAQDEHAGFCVFANNADVDGDLSGFRYTKSNTMAFDARRLI